MTTMCSATDSSAYYRGQWDDEHPLRPGGTALTARALELCRLRPGARVLDLGCGQGEGTRYLRQALDIDIIAVDISPSACSLSKRRQPDADVVCASASSLPFASSSMDAVIAECVLSVVANPECALAECFRVLGEHGRLAITDMYARNPEAIASLRALPQACAAGMMVRAELETELARQGFEIEVWEDHSRLLAEFVARFVMEHGSIERLWTGETDGEEARQASRAMKDVRPSYFLLIARKRIAPPDGGVQP